MISGIDHLVILVDNLESAIDQYRELGFVVTPGGKHPRGTHNALVSFKDGSYLELIAFWEPEYSEHRWHKYLGTGGGIIDHALATDDLAVEISGAGERGVPYEGPRDGARTRPDGVELKWLTAHESVGAGQGLPFLIEDVTDRELRVPGGEATDHPNGVHGIQSLILAVRDIKRTGALYSALLASDPLPGETASRTDQDTTAVALQAGRHTIELHQPEGPGPLADQIARRGDGPYAAVFHGAQELAIDAHQAGGARLSVIVR